MALLQVVVPWTLISSVVAKLGGASCPPDFLLDTRGDSAAAAAAAPLRAHHNDRGGQKDGGRDRRSGDRGLLFGNDGCLDITSWMLGYYFLRSHFPVVISAGRERVFNAEIRSPAGGLLAKDWNNDCILVALECEFGVGESRTDSPLRRLRTSLAAGFSCRPRWEEVFIVGSMLSLLHTQLHGFPWLY